MAVQVHLKVALSDSKLAQRWAKLGSRQPKVSPSCPQVGDNCRQIHSRWLQYCMKAERAKMLEKQMKINDFLCFLCFSSSQYGSKLAQVCPSWRQVGSSRLQVDPKLVQVGPKTAQKGPRCGHARPILVSLGFFSPKNGRDTQRESTSSRRGAGEYSASSRQGSHFRGPRSLGMHYL